MARVFKGKYYGKGSYLLAHLGGRPSWAWRSILEARQIIKAGMRWKAGNGHSIEVWHDPWLPKPITFRPQKVNRTVDQGLRVADLICNIKKGWNEGIVDNLLNTEEALIVKSIPLSWFDQPDEIVWHYTKTAAVCVKMVKNL